MTEILVGLDDHPGAQDAIAFAKLVLPRGSRHAALDSLLLEEANAP
jgi:hypothetical protein